MNFETNLSQLFRVEDTSSIEDHGRFRHAVVNRLPVETLELIPLRVEKTDLRVSERRRGRRETEKVLTSVRTQIPSAPTQASIADLQTVTCFLTNSIIFLFRSTKR